MPKHARPSDLELQVLSLLWRDGPLTVRDIAKCMPDAKPRAYTTILSVLQMMEKKRLVAHRVDGRANRYHAVVTKRAVLGPMLRQLVANVFQGRADSIVQHLLAETPVSDEELEHIRRLIEEHGKSARTGRE